MKAVTKEPEIGQSSQVENTELGDYVRIGMFNFIENSKLDDYSYTGQFCFVQNAEIGKFSNIAASVRIGPTDHPMERPSLHHFTYRRKMYGFDEVDDIEFFKKRKNRKIFIGHDTWIGHNAIIMPEVTIGNGAVVGSGAIVTKDVPPYSIVVGVPARVIGKRFSDDIADKLESIKWWDWKYEKIKENFSDFLLDIEEFVEKHYKGSIYDELCAEG
jgi:hypothetical protein